MYVCICTCTYKRTRAAFAHKLIAGITPTGGEFQNPRSRNLLQPNKSSPTPKRYKKGEGTLIRLKQIP